MQIDALIFSAGLGTRLSPMTDHCPKALVQLDGKELLYYSLLKLSSVDVRNVYINVHHFSEQIISFVQSVQRLFDFDIIISDETDLLLETGGGIKRIASSCDIPLLAFNVDVLFDLDLDSFHHLFQSKNADALLLVKERKTSRYLAFESGRLTGWKNISTEETRGSVSPASDLYAFSGVQILSPQMLADIALYPKTKFSIIEYYLSVCTEFKIEACAISHQWMDVGKIDEFPKAEVFIQSLKASGAYV